MGRLFCRFWLRCAILSTAAIVLTCTTTAVLAESRYCAAECTPVSAKTWGIGDRDGANRPRQRYLSSLIGGEAQTGAIGSRPFKLSVDRVRFTPVVQIGE